MISQVVKIKKINWIDLESFEAEVEFEVGQNTYLAFCHPCNFEIGERLAVNFDFLENEISEEVFWNGNFRYQKKLEPYEIGSLSYLCFGQIIKISPVIIDCGDISLELGDITNDTSVISKYVYFSIARLDIERNIKIPLVQTV